MARHIGVLAPERAEVQERKVEVLRVLRLTRASVLRTRVRALQLPGNRLVSTPNEVRGQVRSLTGADAADRGGPGFKDIDHPATRSRIAARTLARRVLDLSDEICDIVPGRIRKGTPLTSIRRKADHPGCAQRARANRGRACRSRCVPVVAYGLNATSKPGVLPACLLAAKAGAAS